MSGKGGPATGDPLTPPGSGGPGDKPAAGVPAGADIECVLTLSSGRRTGAGGQEDLCRPAIWGWMARKQPYALVKVLSGTLFLKNLSDDKWTVTSPKSGKQSTNRQER